MQPIVFALLVSLTLINTAQAKTVNDSRLSGLSWLIQNQSGDGSWRNTPGLEVMNTATAIQALLNSGISTGYTLNYASAWLQSYQAYSTDALSRKIVALAAVGVNTSDLMNQLLTMQNPADYSWGSYPGFAGSFPDTTLALDAINVTGTSYSNIGYTLGFITHYQNPNNGGWPYYVQIVLANVTVNLPNNNITASQVIPTAQSLLTLNRYSQNYVLTSFINNAVAWLKSQQNASGGFGEDTNGTVLETAIAYQALQAVLGSNDTAVINALNYLVAQQQSNGSWGNNDPLQTALVLAAIPSTVLADSDKDGIPDSLESNLLLGNNPLQAQGRILIPGNGLSIAGTTKAQFLSVASINQHFSIVLQLNNKTPVNNWSIIAGRLPDGLILNGSTGEISGTATAYGVFNFELQAVTNDGTITIVEEHIDVPAGVPAMPDGMLMMLAVVLMITIQQAEPLTRLTKTPHPKAPL